MEFTALVTIPVPVASLPHLILTWKIQKTSVASRREKIPPALSLGSQSVLCPTLYYTK